MTTPIVDNHSEEKAPIMAIGRSIQEHIDAHWQNVLSAKHAHLLDTYNRLGEMAYGTYGEFLFRPVRKELKQAGFRCVPRLPGDPDISREWGSSEDDRQRWMWSTVVGTDGKAVGTIVIAYHHDHTQFRVPRAPQVIALTESGKDAVVEALSQRSAQFRDAPEASVEYAEYLASLGAEQ